MKTFHFTTEIEQKQAADGKVWIHLIPGGQFSAADGRGPFQLDAEAVLASFSPAHPLPVDINHAIDWKSGWGDESPAYGWISALEARDDGIWGAVEWNEAGKKLLAAKSYRYISPVFIAPTGADGIARAVSILRASLCNNPALPQLGGLFTHNGEDKMNKELMTALGLAEDATPEQAVKAAQDLKAAQTAGETASKELCTLREQVAAAESGKSNLEKMVSELNTKLTAQEQAAKREKAEAFVAAALKAGKVVPALKQHFTERYIADPASVELELANAVSINAGGAEMPANDAGGSLSAADKEMCAAMGIDEAAFLATKKKEKENAA